MPTGVPKIYKQCKICGKMFLPKSPSNTICFDTHYAHCPICEKLIVWNSTSKVQPCSKECRKELTRRKNQEKYGCDHPMQNKEVQKHHRESMKKSYGVEYPLRSKEIRERAKETNRKKFGCDWALRNSDVREKSKQTMISMYGSQTTLQSEKLRAKVEDTNVKRYGYTNPMQNIDIQNKQRQSCIEKYGVDNPMKVEDIARKSADNRRSQIPMIIEKSKQTWMEHCGVDNPSKSPEVQKKMTDTFMKNLGANRPINNPECRRKMIATMQERFHADWYVQSKEYFENYSHFRISKTNMRFAELINCNGIECEFEFKLGRYSYDLHVPFSNILIEINPTYTHNSIGNHWDKKGKEPDYHQKKTQFAIENGYRCINVWDWDDWYRIIDMLKKPTIHVSAHDCRIYKLHDSVGKRFIDKYDLYGNCRGQVLFLGLVLKGELVQLMSFKKASTRSRYDVQIASMCTKKDYQVHGGSVKLFQFATKGYDLYNIVAYNDLSKFSGKVFQHMNMKLDHINPPQLIWYDEETGKHIADSVKYLYHKTKEDMIRESYLPIYTCGSAVYVYE